MFAWNWDALSNFNQTVQNLKSVMKIVPEWKDYVEEMKDCRRELQLLRKKMKGMYPCLKEKCA